MLRSLDKAGLSESALGAESWVGSLSVDTEEVIAVVRRLILLRNFGDLHKTGAIAPPGYSREGLLCVRWWGAACDPREAWY